jgi:hypothetical protein
MLRREGAIVSEQGERLERVLRGCAEQGVPDGVDLWPGIRERVSAEAIPGVQTTGDQVPPRRRGRTTRLVPNTLLGWALAVASVLIICAGAYAVAGPVAELVRYGLSGPGGPGVGEYAGGEPPQEALSALRTEVDQTKTADGVRLTLDWAYADERFVAVNLDMQGPNGARKSEGSGSNADAVVFEPSLWDDTSGDEAELPPHVEITDASGQDFDTVGGGTGLGLQLTAAEAVFDVPEGIEPGRGHRFRLEVPLQEAPRVGAKVSGKPEPGPFAFVFEVPVLPAPTYEVGQEVEAGGVAMTLERVVDSPVLPQAVVCYEPPDDDHMWLPPLLKEDMARDRDRGYAREGSLNANRRLTDDCWSLTMGDAVEGRTSVTVPKLEGLPREPTDPEQTSVKPKTIRGPWTFEFEAPG